MILLMKKSINQGQQNENNNKCSQLTRNLKKYYKILKTRHKSDKTRRNF